MAGKFVLKKGSSGKFHFNLLAGNSQVIATSESYKRRLRRSTELNLSKRMLPTRRSTIRPAEH